MVLATPSSSIFGGEFAVRNSRLVVSRKPQRLVAAGNFHAGHLYFLPKEGIGAVVLTNLRAANLFLAAAREKVFELLFDAPPKAEKMIAAAAQSEREAVAGRLARVKTDATSLARLEKIVGAYESASWDRWLYDGIMANIELNLKAGAAPWESKSSPTEASLWC